jgi:putative transposase
MIYIKSNEVQDRKEKLNSSIGKILSSYTRAIQKQEAITGSLFQKHTKSQCLNNNDAITPSYFNSAFGTLFNTDLLCQDYPTTCFEYIHMNPVADNLVSQPVDWEFSSYRDYYSGRNGKLISYERTKTELGIVREKIL